MSFFEFIKTSFWHVAPILLVGVFALAIIVERSRALFMVYPIRDSRGFFDKLTELVISGKLGDALGFCDRFQGKPAARVVKQALLRAHQPEGLIEHGLQIAVGDVTQIIQRRTSFLATIANVATLLGLFGTIAGLIASFEAVGHADPQQKSALLAAGISQAMNATMLGLGVAIPCMIAYSFLINRTNRLIAEVDQSAVKIIDILKQRYYAAESEVAEVPANVVEMPQVAQIPRRSA
ncbi:MAG TPA: MotA/TolQ/ExbB proton channel family protein [Bdellovibrionota bacterium]|nr:MotA/TolQ/ExbB proton channel family protein [Bdellovibrionota bacterium]